MAVAECIYMHQSLLKAVQLINSFYFDIVVVYWVDKREATKLYAQLLKTDCILMVLKQKRVNVN